MPWCCAAAAPTARSWTASAQVGTDPGTEWGTGLTSTADNTLRRKATVKLGDTNTTDAFDPATEWDGYAVDTFDGLGAHTSDCSGPGLPTPPLLEPHRQQVSPARQQPPVPGRRHADGWRCGDADRQQPAPAIDFDPTNEVGTFLWTNASPTGVYSVTFYATDKDGTDEETIVHHGRRPMPPWIPIAR